MMGKRKRIFSNHGGKKGGDSSEENKKKGRRKKTDPQSWTARKENEMNLW